MKTTKTSRKISSAFRMVVRQLTPSEMQEVLRFILFLKTRSSIDPEQAYFWTRGWQHREQAAHRDKRLGRILGDGTAEGLIRSLHA